jgi:hypothetical protein
MNTFLFTSQLVCYGVGIVSSSLNIALYLRRHRAKWRRSRPSRGAGRTALQVAA